MASDARKSPRNPRIEALRLVSIAAIFVFHTFQPWFAGAVDASLSASPVMLWALGCINLLGTFGNHVFYMISGMFLVPRAISAAESGNPGYWQNQARATARRALSLFVSVALYAAAALFVGAFVTTLDGISLHDTYWLLGGIEFIWVYLVLICITPFAGRVVARLGRTRSHRLFYVLLAVAFALNAYIAFVSPGNDVRDLLEWRKLMSAATYHVGFLFGARLTELRTSHPGRLFAGVCTATALVEGAAAASGNTSLLEALSFKSTSLISFALAGSAVLLAANGSRNASSEPGAPSRAILWIAPSILGAYLGQSMFYGLWRPAVDGLVVASYALGEQAFFLTAFAASLLLLTFILLIDRFTRVYLLKLLKLL